METWGHLQGGRGPRPYYHPAPPLPAQRGRGSSGAPLDTPFLRPQPSPQVGSLTSGHATLTVRGAGTRVRILHHALLRPHLQDPTGWIGGQGAWRALAAPSNWLPLPAFARAPLPALLNGQSAERVRGGRGLQKVARSGPEG